MSHRTTPHHSTLSLPCCCSCCHCCCSLSLLLRTTGCVASGCCLVRAFTALACPSRCVCVGEGGVKGGGGEGGSWCLERRTLLVRTHCCGAHCCWTVHVFLVRCAMWCDLAECLSQPRDEKHCYCFTLENRAASWQAAEPSTPEGTLCAVLLCGQVWCGVQWVCEGGGGQRWL
jgi:hypothetical protein